MFTKDNDPSGRLVEETYDVVVVGGGLAGVCAAIAAARHGCNTALVHDRSVLGGVSSSECRVSPGGANSCNAWARETGIIEELQIEERVRNHEPFRNGLINSHWDMVLYDAVRRQDNLALYLNAIATEVEMAGPDRIAAVLAVQDQSERKYRFRAQYFVDCTGDGTVAARAGAEFRMGREAQSEFGESLAPPRADTQTQGSSLLFRARDVGHPVAFTAPGWAEKYPTCASLKWRAHSSVGPNWAGYWWIEVGVPFNTIDQNEEIRDEGLRHVLGVWDHIKNSGEHDADNFALDWIGTLPGKRESRRIVGDYILTEHDVRANTPFEDRVAYGGWWIDIHTMGGILAKDQPPEPSHGDPDSRATLHLRTYSIPFRCLYSRNIANLLMAGRNISVTHVALGTTRLMLTCAVMGQAVGTALGICVREGIAPRELAKSRIAELQETLLRDDCFILDRPNADPADVTRTARAAASSEAALTLEPAEAAQELDWERAQIIPVSEPRIDAISLYLRSELDIEGDVFIEVLPAPDIWSFNAENRQAVAAATISVPPRHEGWFEAAIGADLEPGKLYQVNVVGSPGLFWQEARPVPGVSTARKKPEWSRWIHQRQALAMRLSPESHPFEAANVISGVARPERWTNIWISDPQRKLPQHVELTFDEEVGIDTVYLTFDTNLHVDTEAMPGQYRVPECARDYVVQVKTNAAWETVVAVEGNYQRRRVHSFAPRRARALRVVISATNGAPEARIYEIRAYRQRQ